MAPIKPKEAAPDNHVDLAQEIRRQKRAQRRRRRFAALGVFLALILYLSGAFAAMVSWGSALYESATIAFAVQAGFPVQTGISSIYQVEELSGGFVALGAESCVVYSSGGNRLRSIQSGYLRPAIAVGSNRYLLYHRAGNELRVESRTQTLYTKTYTNSILLAAISENGSVAVATESERYLARITMYSSSMSELLTYDMTDSEGAPIRMAYAPDSKTFAFATISASGGQMLSNLYFISASEGTIECIASEQSTPMAIEWLSNTQCLVIYDNQVVLYDTETKKEIANYDSKSNTLLDYAIYGDCVALLYAQGSQNEVVLLQNMLAEHSTFDANTSICSIAIDAQRIYLVAEKEIDTYSYLGEYVDTAQSEQKILALLVTDQVLIFTENETSVFTPPSLPTE